MHYTPGRFVWHELFTSDVTKSKTFYSALFGWKIEEVGPMKYNMAMKGEHRAGGIMSLDVMGRPGLPSFWLGYVSVPNVEEAAAAVSANGGLAAAPPMDVPGMGRFSIFGDPTHAYSAAWRSNTGDTEAPPATGTFCRDQINSTDPERVVEFYQKVYGWRREPFPGSSEMSIFKAGDATVASAMKAPPGAPSHWLSYVAVDQLDATKKETAKLGGKVVVDRISIPTVGDIAVIMDNVGATIGLFEAPRA